MGVEDLDSWWSPLPRTVGVTHKPRITKSGTPVCRRAREKLCQMYSDGILWRKSVSSVKSREQVAFSSSYQ